MNSNQFIKTNPRNLRIVAVFALLSIQYFSSFGQKHPDNRGQFPIYLANSYVGLNLGYVNYPFTNEHLQPGYSAESITIPNFSLRIIIGHEFSKYLSAQISYMRPVSWVRYNNVNGDKSANPVAMNIAGLTIRPQIPIGEKFSLFAEAGLGVVTRRGFKHWRTREPIMTDEAFGTFLVGGGLRFHVNNKWDFNVSGTYTPPNANQPQTWSISAGFQHTMRPRTPERLEIKRNSGYIFPRNLIQVGYTTNGLGYGANKFFSEYFVIFWGGAVEIEEGFSMYYVRNIYHAKKAFSLDWGASIGYYSTRHNKQKFYTISLFPSFRFWIFHTQPVSMYFNYVIAGPTYISEVFLDGRQTGSYFTFQDFMGFGWFFGTKKNVNFELKINHFSNGNIFSQNPGLKIPLTFKLGYGF